MTTLGYTRSGEYLVPNLTLKEHSGEDIGKYGRLRRAYLMEHRKGLYTGMLLNETLYEHLLDVNRTCLERIDGLVWRMAADQGVTEALKANDQMEWVRRMNGIRRAAEELVLDELVYC
ncbi:hypothetical protein CE91St41_06770 [Oscillospiraceae bacterium]|nr:hypothetical protein CE91St40_06770 [Oscillospiraceae bacterium]BDF73788.1 hypothetical protein CE91St41_06770 [Oscillospiraceae bacterium]